MPRGSARQKLATGIYTDGGKAIEIEVMVNGHRITERHPAGTPLAYLIDRRKLLQQDAATLEPVRLRGTLAGDAPRYLALSRHLHATTVRSRKAHLNAWMAALGANRTRHTITSHEVLEARAAWLDDGLSPKTINHRLHTLRRLYKILDGKRTPTPCDDVDPLPIHKTPIRRVTPAVLLAVHKALYARTRLAIKHPTTHTAARRLEALKTHARFCVLVSTGRRPSELMRAEPGDVDLEHRVWIPRDGKGGWSPGVYLNDDMLAAWQRFVAADAWGVFSVSAYAKRLRRAGWPKDIRPYNARHSLLIAMVEAGADMADVQTHAGHRQLSTTRNAYTGILGTRVQATSERVSGRLGGFTTDDSGTDNFGTDAKPPVR